MRIVRTAQVNVRAHRTDGAGYVIERLERNTEAVVRVELIAAERDRVVLESGFELLLERFGHWIRQGVGGGTFDRRVCEASHAVELSFLKESEQFVELRIHNVTPRFVREIRELGFDRLDVEELVEMSIHHVTPRFIREMRNKFDDQLSIEQLVEMRIHGIDEDMLENLRSAGIHVSQAELRRRK